MFLERANGGSALRELSVGLYLVESEIQCALAGGFRHAERTEQVTLCEVFEAIGALVGEGEVRREFNVKRHASDATGEPLERVPHALVSVHELGRRCVGEPITQGHRVLVGEFLKLENRNPVG